MEQNRLLQLSMDPNLTPAWKEAVNNALNQSMLNTAMAFGGADITKEQRLQWEKENKEFRAKHMPTTERRYEWRQAEGWPDVPYQPGTRVSIRPRSQRMRTADPSQLRPNEYGEMAGGTGVVVDPRASDAGPPAYQPSTEATRRPPTPEHVAVRGDASGHWFWVHPETLEVLPPLEKFPVGTKVQWEYRGKTWTGTVGEIPRSGHDKEYWHDQKKHIWIDNDVGPDEKPWGGWLPPEWLTKRKK